MRKDIVLEKEVERTIGKFNSIKRLPSAFSNSSSKPRLDNKDRIIIILGVLLFLFFFSKVITKQMVNLAYYKLNETGDLSYFQKSSYENHYLLMESSIVLYKDIQIEGVEDG